jgi:hypothetical protein
MKHESILHRSNPLIAARFSKSMLGDALAQEVLHNFAVQFWASRYLGYYESPYYLSKDEGEFAKSMLETIRTYFRHPQVREWADRCFSFYATAGMSVNANAFAEGMLEILRRYGSGTADLLANWEQRRSSYILDGRTCCVFSRRSDGFSGNDVGWSMW